MAIKTKTDSNGYVYPMSRSTYSRLVKAAKTPAEMPDFKKDGSPFVGSGVGGKESRFKRSRSGSGDRNGFSGRKHTEETKQKLREARKSYTHSATTKALMSKAGKGRKHTEETKRKMSEAKKGRKFTDEHRRAISKGWEKRGPVSEETRRKQSAARKGLPGKPHTEETKQKLREAQKNRKPVSDETRAKISAAGKGRKFTDEHRRKIGEANRRRWQSDKAREKQSLTLKKKTKDDCRGGHRDMPTGYFYIGNLADGSKSFCGICEPHRLRLREGDYTKPSHAKMGIPAEQFQGFHNWWLVHKPGDIEEAFLEESRRRGFLVEWETVVGMKVWEAEALAEELCAPHHIEDEETLGAQ